MNTAAMQRAKCEHVGAPFFGAPADAVVGVAEGIDKPGVVLNGLRHAPSAASSGWYIWPGAIEPTSAADYFAPIHLDHLSLLCPRVVPFLGLPPGWRFLIADDYEDVWFDPPIALVDG
jgi:hypothetical protein